MSVFQIRKFQSVACLCLLLFTSVKGCGKENEPLEPPNTPTDVEATLNIQTLFIEKECFKSGDMVQIPQLKISNESELSLQLNFLKARIKRLSTRNAEFRHDITLMENRVMHPGDTIQVEAFDLWLIPNDAKGAYGIYMEYDISSPDTSQYILKTSNKTEYNTFLRVSDKPALNTFEINSAEYMELPVYSLSRGLSAEYSIQKSAASLMSGISHSWSIPLGPVNSTPQFLEKSIKKTVDFYNQEFGAEAVFKTVVISTGIPSAAYLANAMHAPILPLHFLVGVETVKEVKTILDHSNTHGLSAYATLGHDYSISTTKGIAWIKLLDLPGEYLDFIVNHKVERVVFLGYSGSFAGEVQARKVKDDKEKYDPGSLYLMYFAGASAETYLRQTLRDFEETEMEGLTTIADWESGIIPSQIDNFTNAIRESSPVDQVYLISSNNDVALWDLGAYLMLAYMHKNRDNYDGNNPIAGVSLNPYLIAHPFFESRMGYVPFLYWQGSAPAHHIDERLQPLIANAIEHYFPEVNFYELNFWVNSTHNFGGIAQGSEMAGFLKSHGYVNVIENDYSFDEVWNPENGMNSAVELRTEMLINSDTWIDLQNWKESMQALEPEDLHNLSSLSDQIYIIEK